MPIYKNKSNSVNVLLTIAIPTYKRPDLLYCALKSAVNQSYSGTYEIVVVDNCIDKNFIDRVDNVINSFSDQKRINLYRNKSNVGMFGNWNECLKRSKGKYITILNDDDLLDYKFVENVLRDIKQSKMLIYNYQILSENKRPAKVGGYLRLFFEKFNLIGNFEISLSNILHRNPSNGSLGVVFNRKNGLLIGGYDKKYFPASDYYFNYKYIARYGGLYINKKLAKYRILVNESLKIENLKSFVLLDYQLRREICISHFKKNNYLFKFSNYLNSLQGCSQISRYILLRGCKNSQFDKLDLGINRKLRQKLTSFLTIHQYVCIFLEVLILLTWRILFHLKKIL